jgi:release factor glutamine methyltransferase
VTAAAQAETSHAALLASARARLAAAGVPDAAREARRLLQLATGLDAAALAARHGEAAGAGIGAALAEIVARRARREPLARIKGEQDFWGMAFALSPATMVPRPETETLVEAVLEAIAAEPAEWNDRSEVSAATNRRRSGLRILDVGIGSGAILAALLAELPDAFGVGCDIAEAALVTARRNLRRHGLARRGAVVLARSLATFSGGFDVVVANPPYVATAEIASLAPEVRDHDPRAALDGGADGLHAYRTLVPAAPRRLHGGGLLALEIGWNQADAVAEIVARAGFSAVHVRQDLGGRDRVVLARRT